MKLLISSEKLWFLLLCGPIQKSDKILEFRLKGTLMIIVLQSLAVG